MVYHALNETEKIFSLYFSWKLKEDSGQLIAYQLKRQDEGRYTCIAENAAGRIEAETELDVINKGLNAENEKRMKEAAALKDKLDREKRELQARLFFF